MNYPTIVGAGVVICTFGGALFGMWFRTALRENHLDADSKDLVKISIGLVAMMTALVLGLVLATAKRSYDLVDSTVRTASIELLALDRVLARYGRETDVIRQSLQRGVATRIDLIWPQDASNPTTMDPKRAAAEVRAEGIADAIHLLKPRDDAQRTLQARALHLAEVLLESRWIVFEGADGAVPVPFLVILVFWLTFTFASFGLLAPHRAAVLAVLFLCALCVGSAIFLALELDTPFQGWVKISPEPFRYAYAQLMR
jgi:hypothetical protein